MKKTIFLLFVTLFFVSAYFAATYNLGLSPLKAELVMYPGETREYDLRLVNNTLADVDYQLEIGSFKLDENGKYVYLDRNDDYAYSAAKWASYELNTDHILVKAMEQKKVKIKVTIPRTLKKGGDYYAMIWANFIPSRQGNTKKASGASISIERRFRFGSILHIEVKGRPTVSKLKIEKISMINFDEISTSTERGIELDVFVKNTGDTSYRPSGDFVIVSPDRKVWGRGKLEMNQTDLVMPSLTRKMFARYDRTLPTGNYTAKVSVKSGNRYLGQKEFHFFVKASTSNAKLSGVNFKVVPQQLIDDTRAGYTYMGKMEIYNREFSTVDVELSTVEMSLDEKGVFSYGDTTHDVRIYPPHFSLRENQKRVIPFSLRIPKDAEGAVLFAIKVKTSLENSPENSSIFHFPVMIRLDGTTKYGFKVVKTERISISSSKTSNDVLRVWFKNTGNVFTNFNVFYDVVDPNGNYLTPQARRLSERGFLIFPNSERYVDIPLDYKFKEAGRYSVPFLLVYKADKNKDKKIEMKVYFEVTEKETGRKDDQK